MLDGVNAMKKNKTRRDRSWKEEHTVGFQQESQRRAQRAGKVRPE
jgi:hypothetical protein